MKLSLSANLTLLLLLSSCALPPREAWNKIQLEGLLAYLRHPSTPARYPSAIADYEQVSPPPPSPNLESFIPTAPPVQEVAVRTYTRPLVTTQAPRTSDNIEQPTITPSKPTAVVKSSNSDKLLVAQSVPSLPGFVRSPYTSPPRLVDVKGAKAGATMICPYTQRPFLIPDDYTNAVITPGLVINHQPTIKPSVTPVPALEKHDPVVVTKKEIPATSSPAASIFNSAPVAPSNPPPVITSTTQPKVTPQTKPEVSEIPFGFNISGRPGFVHSPYAAKNQLVDVTGLPPGMEVKCPYTGKIFRVPGRDFTDPKGTILAAPEKIEKK